MPPDLNRLETDVHRIADAKKTTHDNVHRNSLAHGPILSYLSLTFVDRVLSEF
jgi:hypothetical protein